MSRAAPGVAGRVVAITGAARGIGAAIARALAGAGAKVALGDLDGELAASTAAGLGGGGAAGFDLDVTSTDSFACFLDRAAAAFGPLDVLVNNAGILWVGPFDSEPEAAALRQLDVNLHGVVRGMKLAVPGMRERGRGHVVNIASAASKVAPAGEATYCASKHAVYGYSAAVRAELEGTGVEVSVVMPGVVETELAIGTSHGRGRRLSPDEVGAAVIDVLQRPRFDVFVPRSIGRLHRIVSLLPTRGQDAALRALVPNQVTGTEYAARREYEERVVVPKP